MTTKDLRDETVHFISLNYTANPSLEGHNYPAAEIIPLVDEIYVEDGKEKRKKLIRYMPGESSIFFEDQDNKYDVNGKIRKFNEPFVLHKGILTLSKKETMALDYMRATNRNAADPKVLVLNGKKVIIHRMNDVRPMFKEMGIEQEAAEFIKKDKEELKLRNLVYSMGAFELEAYALVLGDLSADTKSTEEIRRDLSILAKNNPEKFKEGMEDVNMKRKVFVLHAFKAGFIIYNDSTRKIIWQNGDEIVTVPPTAKPADYLVSLSSDGKYAEIFNAIKKMVQGGVFAGKATNGAGKELPKTEEPQHTERELPEKDAFTPTATFDEEDAENLFVRAVMKGILTRDDKHGYYYSLYESQKFRRFAKGRNQAINYILNNPDLQNELTERLDNNTKGTKARSPAGTFQSKLSEEITA